MVTITTLEDPAIILITGVMAAGKSTVAQALAERLPKSVHLRGDLFRRMIINGQVPMSFELSDEALAQLKLRYAIAATVAPMYWAAGFTVIYQDIILGETLVELVERLRPYNLHVVVLCPDVTTVTARETTRGKRGYGSASEIGAFDRVLRETTPRLGLWVDTTILSIGETVDQMLANLEAAAIRA